MIFDNESKRYTISMIKNLEDRRNQLTRNILYNG